MRLGKGGRACRYGIFCESKSVAMKAVVRCGAGENSGAIIDGPIASATEARLRANPDVPQKLTAEDEA